MRRFLVILLITFSMLKGDVLFQKGSVGVGAVLGSGSATFGAGSNDYFIVGVSGDYFIVDDLSVGMGVTLWTGSDPKIMQYTLPVVYYFETSSKISPYLGVFYRYTDYLGEDAIASSSSGGIKGGVAYRVSFGYVAAGVVSENNFDTKENSTYPEFTLGFLF